MLRDMFRNTSDLWISQIQQSLTDYKNLGKQVKMGQPAVKAEDEPMVKEEELSNNGDYQIEMPFELQRMDEEAFQGLFKE